MNGDFEYGTVASTVGGFSSHGVPYGWAANEAFDRFYEYNHVEDALAESGNSGLQISNLDGEPLATLSQSFNDVAGATYSATFYARVGLADRDPNAYLQVSVGSDGVILHDDVPAAFHSYSFSFVGTGSDALAISAQDTPSFWYVDNASVTGASMAASAPEAATWAMMLLGFAGFALLGARNVRDPSPL